MTAPQTGLTCEEVRELAGVYVLDALDADEREAVRSHVASCPSVHEELAELGATVPALSLLVEPLDAPRELRARVLDAVAADARGEGRATLREREAAAAATGAEPISLQRERERRRRPLGSWLLAAAAVLVIAALGAWNVALQSQAAESERREALLTRAVAAATAPGSQVATLSGTGLAAGATGFAAFPEGGTGYVLLVDIPPAPTGHAYQAWYIADGQPVSAGLMRVGADGYAVMELPARDGTDQIALTVEQAAAAPVEAPSGAPVVIGELG